MSLQQAQELVAQIVIGKASARGGARSFFDVRDVRGWIARAKQQFGKMLRPKLVVPRERDRRFENLFQLPDVQRPAVFKDGARHLAMKRQRLGLLGGESP